MDVSTPTVIGLPSPALPELDDPGAPPEPPAGGPDLLELQPLMTSAAIATAAAASLNRIAISSSFNVDQGAKQ
jgi:hypothetical protein